MQRRTFLKSGAAVTVGATAGCVGQFTGGGGEAEFPADDITIWHPYGSASTPAALSLLLQNLNQEQEVFPVNFRTAEKTGGGGIVGYNSIWNAEPDGYTLADSVGASMLLKPLVQDEANYDPPDYTYMPTGVVDYGGGAVPADSDIESGQDYIDAVADGGSFSAVSPTSSITVKLMIIGDLTGFWDPANILDQMVQYGIAEAIPAIVKGEVDFGGLNLSALAEFIKSGDLRVPIYFHKRDDLPDVAFELAPDADTLEDVGMSGSNIDLLNTMYPPNVQAPWLAPPDVPEDRAEYLNDGIMEIVQSSAWKTAVSDRNLGIPEAVDGPTVQSRIEDGWNNWQDRPELVSLWTS